MAVSIPHSICAKVQKTSDIREVEARNRKDDTDGMRTQWSRDTGSKCVSGSHPSVGEHTAQDGSVKVHGDIERKNESDDI